MEKKYVLSLDQGTTSSRAILFDKQGKIAGMAQKEFTQIYPQPGYVEHDPMEILSTEVYAIKQAVLISGAHTDEIAAIGITNQRETTIAWDADTGKPVYNAIVWQCRRTAPICEQLKADGMEDYIRNTCGLIIDPYFSGTKMKWILDNVPKARELAQQGKLRFGTVDTWLVWHLTGGKTYVTDVTNASRTMMFDIHKLCWDKKMREYFGVPESALPEVRNSSEIVGYCDKEIFGTEIPISGIAGDQHAALFGQCCFEEGMAKNTYGTGCFVLMNTGESPVISKKGLLSTIAWGIGGKVTYALEGSAFNAGSAIQWMRDELKMIENPQEANILAESVKDTAGAVFVPAFTGLGAPYWDMYARGTMMGITRGCTKAHFARAVLESIAYESKDLLDTISADSGVELKELRVDGGASRSKFLMQFQADIINTNIVRPECLETTAMGAAMLAGLATGLWKDLDELKTIPALGATFTPNYDEEKVNKLTSRWHKAVNACMGWAED
ncbi:MAG: glycerol kinase GlpK [Clostridia bacterium]|nr:glycerol kinase GlpK [Clostridia bacterium]